MLNKNRDISIGSNKNYLHRDYLKDQRKLLKLTADDVSYLLDISRDYYSQIENGARGKNLSVRMLVRISQVLKMDLCEIINFEKKFIQDCDHTLSESERLSNERF
ncbi:MAG: helix-turn-helix transcriptional regulator [Tenericutes bacterium]|nr:helix-turn-helix transcriptional regulator [Mycoplasmatota bacterium]